MIYIFKGVQSICSLPGLACKACGDLCAQCNCTFVKDCCDSMASCVKHFFERPLSIYVVVSILIGIWGIYGSYLGMSLEDPKVECGFDGPVDGSMWGMLQIAVGIINIVFAFYFQRQVWGKIMEYVLESPDTATLPVEPPGPSRADKAKALIGGQQAVPTPLPEGYVEKVLITKDTVQRAFKNIFLEDFGVLAFFILMVANLGVTSFMVTVKEGSPCTDAFGPFALKVPLVTFLFALLYTLAYYCCTCCADKVEIDKSEAVSGTPAPVE